MIKEIHPDVQKFLDEYELEPLTYFEKKLLNSSLEY